MFQIYSFLLTVGFIFMSPIFLLKRAKYAAGFWQRMGYLPEFTQNENPVLWIHCVSVGETNAAKPLIEELKKQFPNYRIVVSTTTKTGQELAENIFKTIAEKVFYFPFDWKFTVNRALKHFKPKAVLIMETELWFNFIREANKNGVFIALVNGRLSEKSVRNYSFVKSFIERVLRRLDLALMQSQADAKRILQLGIRPSKVKVTGNIKFDQKPETNDLTEIFRERFAVNEDAPLIVAASTHAPEEKWILDVFKQVFKNSPEKLPRLMLVPRHPERFEEVANLIKETGFSFVRRSQSESERDKTAEIILLDSIGELRAVYPLAEMVFVGGSLIPHGGQSVLEPALNGKAIVTGFYTMNFTAVVKEFLEKNALVQLPKLEENEISDKFAEELSKILKDDDLRRKLGENAFEVMNKNRGATEKTLEYLKHFLDSKV
ncbi:MAG: 3-deoxy-D-manno-octulosonic acid transferase [Pyrinomonadaceae bacterium]|nr:3-deoxy-D-manno-octulosonic acid transferase [Pyrinomonadaceae bacterium]